MLGCTSQDETKHPVLLCGGPGGGFGGPGGGFRGFLRDSRSSGFATTSTTAREATETNTRTTKTTTRTTKTTINYKSDHLSRPLPTLRIWAFSGRFLVAKIKKSYKDENVKIVVKPSTPFLAGLVTLLVSYYSFFFLCLSYSFSRATAAEWRLSRALLG